MGVNYYLYKKINYAEDMPVEIGCGDGKDYVNKVNNGYIYDNTYYKNIKSLNKNLYQKIHIGKSSAGWHFLLAIYPEFNINTLDDWKVLFSNKDNVVKNDYNEVISADEMINTIINRSSYDNETEEEQLASFNRFEHLYGSGKQFSTFDDLLAANNAVRGKNYLWAHMPDTYTSNTDGTYDYIISGNDLNKGVIFS